MIWPSGKPNSSETHGKLRTKIWSIDLQTGSLTKTSGGNSTKLLGILRTCANTPLEKFDKLSFLGRRSNLKI